MFVEKVNEPSQGPLGTRHNFSSKDQGMSSHAIVVDVFKLSQEHGLLQHAQKDDTTDPELNPEQLTPSPGTQDEPNEAHKDVQATHKAVKGEQRPVRHW